MTVIFPEVLTLRKKSSLIVEIFAQVEVVLELETGELALFDPFVIESAEPVRQHRQEVAGDHQHVRKNADPVYGPVDDVLKERPNYMAVSLRMLMMR